MGDQRGHDIPGCVAGCLPEPSKHLRLLFRRAPHSDGTELPRQPEHGDRTKRKCTAKHDHRGHAPLASHRVSTRTASARTLPPSLRVRSGRHTVLPPIRRPMSRTLHRPCPAPSPTSRACVHSATSATRETPLPARPPSPVACVHHSRATPDIGSGDTQLKVQRAEITRRPRPRRRLQPLHHKALERQNPLRINLPSIDQRHRRGTNLPRRQQT